MHYKQYISQLVQASNERQRCFLINISLSVVLLVQTLFIVFHQKNERTIVVPMQLSQSFWIDENQVSESYLIEMSRFIAGSILTVTPESAKTQEEVLLRFAYPSHRGQLAKQWQEWLTRVEQEQVSHVFLPQNVEANSKNLTAIIDGELLTFIGEDKLQQVEASYQLGFIYQHGRLWLSTLNAIDKKSTKSQRKGE
jgi:type IV conjugative transfer system protein TraE